MSSVFVPNVLPHQEKLIKDAEQDDDRKMLKTAPFDPRFPNQNQTRYCYQSYLDFQRCKRLKGEEYEACQYFKRIITSICPYAWLEKWDQQIVDGVFPGKI